MFCLTHLGTKRLSWLYYFVYSFSKLIVKSVQRNKTCSCAIERIHFSANLVVCGDLKILGLPRPIWILSGKAPYIYLAFISRAATSIYLLAFLYSVHGS